MDDSKYNRSISMICETCGCDQFEHDETDDDSTKKCEGCGREYSKDELIEVNQEGIDSQVEEIGKEAMDDLTKDLKKAFKGFK